METKILNIIKRNTQCDISNEIISIWTEHIYINGNVNIPNIDEIKSENCVYMKFLYTCLSLMEIKNINESTPIKVIGNRHDDIQKMFKSSLEEIINKESGKSDKYHLLLLYSSSKYIKDKDLFIIKEFICDGYNYSNLNLLILNKKSIISKYKEEIVLYLNNIEYIEIKSNVDLINKLINLFTNLKLDIDPLKKIKENIKIKKDIRIESMFNNMVDISLELYVDNIYNIEYQEGISKCMENLPTLDDSCINGINKTKNGYIKSKFNPISIKKFKCIMYQLVNKVDGKFKRELRYKISTSTIRHNMKLILYEIMDDNISVMFRIDSLVTKFEGIIKEHLITKGVDISYIDDNKKHELSLGNDNRGLIRKMMVEYPSHIDKINLINYILNDGELYNLRNEFTHSISLDYREFNYKLLLIALNELVMVID